MRTLSAYVHVPFCASRCGYCDFNTYTAAELTKAGVSVGAVNYAEILNSEISRSAPDAQQRELHSVFFGGGTPTLLAANDLVTILDQLRASYGLTRDVEVTTEANPDSVSKEYLAKLREGGFTRVSFGHQSSAPNVLAILERTHTPGRTWQAVQWAKEVGFEQISVDLIYGTPGESIDDLQLTLEQVVAADLQHVSAYSLIVESGTRLARQVTQGVIPMPSDDVAAARYELIDDALSAAGFTWYEVSNWAKPDGECRHNLAYWYNQDWLGFGPGAHAHEDGHRYWKTKHPAAWASALADGDQALAGQEWLTEEERQHEEIMLRLRLRSGLPLSVLSNTGRAQAQLASNEGLLEVDAFENGLAILTDKGRLLADGLVTRLWS
jgi:oxygen-independent coproporphyrinogen-3 oxidase